MWMNTYLSRDIRQWGPTAHNEENPRSLVFSAEDTWKYHAERLAIE